MLNASLPLLQRLLLYPVAALRQLRIHQASQATLAGLERVVAMAGVIELPPWYA
jgi:hypothetical protein